MNFRRGLVVLTLAALQLMSIDNIAPAVPTSLVGDFSDGSVNMTWSAPEDDDFSYFTIFLNIFAAIPPCMLNFDDEKIVFFSFF